MANRDAILNLKVFIQKSGAAKVLRFGSDMSVAECLKEILEKTGEGGRDHGLFLPPNKESGKKGQWLSKNKALRFYGIKNNETIEYKKTHRPLRIKLMDETSKVVIIDDSSSVREVCDTIGEKIGLKSAEEFSLRKPLEPGMSKAPKWLNEQQTLHEQDIAEDEELVYAKKYFYSDDVVDKDDPFTLHLLYVEANKSIIEGKYPVTRGDAKDFAALQMQIVYGDHDPNKHKPGFYDKNSFLPKQYRKDDKLEKEILRDHKKLVGMKEMNAKYRYVQLVRSLKTYGITFFDCKEKPRGKKKGARVFIGVTREKICKVDPETMQTVKEWTIEQMRRWSFAHGSFTLDFGDYEDDYITVETDEGEALSQLIAGYIDIILKTRVDTERVVEDDDDDIGNVEMMEGQFGIANTGMTMSFSNPYGQGAGAGAMMDPGMQHARNHPGAGTPGGGKPGMGPGMAAGNVPVPPSSRVNVVDMGSAVKCTRLLATELGAGKGRFGMPGKLTAEEWQKQFNTHKANLDGKVGDLLASAKMSPGSLNRNQLDGKAKEIANEMQAMAAAARNLAELSDDNIPLLDGSRAMSDTVADLLEMMMKAVDDPNSPGLPQALALAEKQLASANYLSTDPTLAQYVDAGAELLMLECIDNAELELNGVLKTVADAMQSLPPQKAQLLKQEMEMMEKCKGFALGTMKNLAPRILEPEADKQVLATYNLLNKMNMDMVGKVRQAGIPQEFDPILTDASDRFNTALKNLLESAKTAEQKGIEGNIDIHGPVNELMNSLASLRTNVADGPKVVEGVKAAANAQNKVIAASKQLAASADPATKERLMNAANNISKLVKDLVNDARVLYKNPDDLTMQGKVTANVGKLEGQCQELLTDAGSMTALNNLRYSSKATSAAILKLATASNMIGAQVGDNNARAELLASAKSVQKSLANLLGALQGASKNPSDSVRQSELLEAARNQVPHYSDLVAKAKKAARFVNDPNKKQDITYASNETGDALQLLMKAVNEVSDMGGQTDIEDALQEFDAVKADLETAEFYAHQGLLTPIPGQTRENAQELLKMAADTLNKSINDLQAAAKNGGKLPEHVKQAAAGMAQLASAARSMASTVTDRNQQKRIVGSAKTLSNDTLALISLGRSLAIDKSNPEKIDAMKRGRNAYDATLGNLLESMAGLELKDVNKAIEDIERETDKLKSVPPSRMTYKDASDGLQSSGKALSAAISQLVSTARLNPNLLGSSAKMTGATTTQLIQMCSNAAGSAPDKATTEAILAAAKALSQAMSGLLNSAKVSASKKTPDALNQLGAGEKAAQKAVEDLVNALGNASNPEAEHSISKIMNTIAQLDSGAIEMAPGNREDLLNEFLACAKDLARVTGSLVSSARVSANKLGLFSKEAASTVKNLLHAAKAASACDGTAATMSLDGGRIIKGTEYILENPKDSQRVMACAKKITQAGTKLINNAKEHAKAEPDKNRRAAVVKNAQLVVNFATQLGQVSRAASTKQDPATIKALTDCASQLKAHTLALEDSMRSSKPGDKSEAIDPAVARELMTTSRTIAVATTDLIRASSAVSSNQDNEVAAGDLKRSTRTVTESIQNLIKTCGALNPGVQECERAIQVIQKASAELEATAISATVGNLQVPGSATANFQQCQNETGATCKQLAEDLKTLASAAGGSSKDLVAAALTVQKSIPELVKNSKLVAATGDRASQSQVLNLSKAVIDGFGDLVKAVSNCNLNDKESMTFMTQKANEASESIGLLLGQLQSGVQLQQELDNIVKKMQEKLSTLSTKPAPGADKSYQECREELNGTARELAAVVTSLHNVDKRNIGQVGLAANRVGGTIGKLVDHARLCIAVTREQEAQKEIGSQTKNIGENVINMVQIIKAIITGKPAVPQLRQAFNDTNTAIAQLLAAAKKGAVGEVMMDRAIEDINGSITKLNTSSIFAQAGQLEADKSAMTSTIAKLQQDLAAASQNLGQMSAAVSKSTRANEEELGKTAAQLAQAVASVADMSTKTASRMPDNLGQQDVLSSAKTLAIASHQLILAAKDAQRLPNDNTAQQTLVASQNAINESINNLATVVQRSSAEVQRGERELESSKQQISQALKNIKPNPKATAEDVVQSARQVLAATGELVFASNQEEMIQAGKTSVNSVQGLLYAAGGAAKLSPDAGVQRGIQSAAENVAKSMCELIEVAKLDRSNDQSLPKLEAASGKVTGDINSLIDNLKKLPNAQHIKLEDKDDLDKVAEEELLKCAEIIKSAANTLANAKPPPREKKIPGVLDQMDINGAIIDAATAIAKATGMLVSHAYDAQRERVANRNKPGGKRYQNDPTWANGLISASHNVAGAVQALVSSANKTADGKVEEEELVATARAVASATAHLVSASKAKADPNSTSQGALSTAAKSVANATSQLVSAAHTASQFQEEEKEEDISAFTFGGAGGKVKELEQQMRILKLEKELEQERVRMLKLRKAKYEGGNKN
eukprot:TRINITY_DN227_c1_g1_i1.p1 TRINITY_DN227_c1_g1~~TRINITY_DN227_c1_g1_i1.p1  ORF type:complete len:2471 (-),score=884.91 TRINITY_DN227_c1_g1_i1:132-7544(-)